MDQSMESREVHVVLRVKEERSIPRKITRKEVNWIGHIVRRNCLLKSVIEGKTEGRKDEEEEVYSYWMTFKEKEDLGN